jgi:hypothetical protein
MSAPRTPAVLPITTAVLAILAAACGGSQAPPAVPEPQPIAIPAAAGAATPFAAPAGSAVLLSWVEATPAGHALRFARWDGSAVSEPGTVAEGAGWFANWADFPSIMQLPDGRLAAHWLQRSGPGRYSYDVMLTWSDDSGATWSAPVSPHRDGTESEHGFVSLFAYGSELGLAWLDGRQFVTAAGSQGDDGHGSAGAGAPDDAGAGHGGTGGGEMMVVFTTLRGDGSLGEELVLDRRACDCCQTAVASTAAGPVVFYRDRSPDEVRDIAFIQIRDGVPSAPRTVHDDGWVIHGCPVNGPAADARGDDVAVAWFTAAGEEPKVNVAFSRDAGESFGPPVRIDEGEAVGRVDLLFTDDGRAFVVWLEHAGEGAELRGRLVDPDGRAGPARTLAATSAQRASGFPRMARRGADVLLLWTEPGEPSNVAAAVIPFGAGRPGR